MDLGEFQPRDGLQACGSGQDGQGRSSAIVMERDAWGTKAGMIVDGLKCHCWPSAAWKRGCGGWAARIEKSKMRGKSGRAILNGGGDEKGKELMNQDAKW